MAASPEDIAKGVKMAEQEMDYRVDLYNRCGATSLYCSSC